MEILLVNHYSGHPQLGMEFRPYYLASKWMKMGHRVKIAASSFSHLRHTQPKTSGSTTKEILDGVEYHWLKTPSYKGNGIGRLLNIFTFLWSLRKWVLIQKDWHPDVVIASSTYPMDIYLCHWIAKRYKAQLIFEVHDLWPLSPMELGNISKWHPLMMLMQHAENYAYKHCDKVVSILPKTLEHMKSQGLEETKFHHIPNGIFTEDWSSSEPLPPEHGQTIQAIRDQGKKIVGYAGALGVANNMQVLLEAAPFFDKDITFVIVGKGPEKETLQKQVQSKKIPNIVFLPPINKRQVPCFLKKMDAFFLSLQPRPLYRFGVSLNKLFDYMMAGKPIIYAGRSGNRPVLDAQCGIEVQEDDPRKLAEEINQLFKKKDQELEKMGANGQDYVQAHHDYNQLAKKFIDLMSAN